ncbi:MAG TPA: class I SAM-dependent methyltransferase [Saprospiraceae bacterium]|nr:class I SAM-dependent methyltransferase [Saprospiraceae bacterium]
MQISQGILEYLSENSQADIFAVLYDIAFSLDTDRELSVIQLILQKTLGHNPENLCEAGAGTGRFILPLAISGLKTTAVEPNIGMYAVFTVKINEFLRNSPISITKFRHNFEDIILTQKYDAILVMTDTLSYVWPIEKAKQFLGNAKHLLTDNGVLILDIALWATDEGNRKEEWSILLNDGFVKGSCFAQITREGKQTFRVEELSFRGRINNMHLQASNKQTLHAFTWETLVAFCNDCGFTPILLADPYTSKIVISPQGYNRLFIALKKT